MYFSHLFVSLQAKSTRMKRLLLIFCTLYLCCAAFGQRVIVVKAGDVSSLLEAIDEVNKTNADRQSERTFVLIPNGYYDLGERVLTCVRAHNVAFVGQDRYQTIIRNAPPRENEGIGKTAVLQNRGIGNYYQDLSLVNDLDYYSENDDGRAVTLHDKGDRTICNRVRMLSHQDTYYTDNVGCQHYLKETEIHGTVDFICGTGDVWFERCLLVTMKRSDDGSGRDVIAAPRTAKGQWGFVMNRCTVKNYVSSFQYARGWHTTPRNMWLHTTLLTPEKLMPTRFDPKPIRGVNIHFLEYGTMDAQGHDITPKSNMVTYSSKGEERTEETIATADEAKRYTLKNVFPDWQPEKTLCQLEKKAKKLKKQYGLQ